MNDKHLNVLLNIGNSISIISREYINNLFPNVVIKNLHGILSNAEKLLIRWGSQENLPYKGYAELDVSLDNNIQANEILVPFLILLGRLPFPMLDTNAIKHIWQNYRSNQLADVLNKCFLDKSKNVIEFLLNFIHAEKFEELLNVRTPKHYQEK